MKTPGFRLFGLRGKLLIATLTTLFVLPVAGFSYLKQMEQFLKKNQVDSVTAIAGIIASTFDNDQAIKTVNKLTQSSQQAIYSHQLNNTIVIDGYADDWTYLQDQKQSFYTRKNNKNYSFSVIAANDNRNFYFLISVNDDDLQYKKSLADEKYNNDHIKFNFLDNNNISHEYLFITEAPGWVRANRRLLSGNYQNRSIYAEWQESNSGYNLEFSLPLESLGQFISFSVNNTNSNGFNVSINSTEDEVLNNRPVTQTADNVTSNFNPLIRPVREEISKLTAIVPANSQLWLLNNKRYVIASITAKEVQDKYEQPHTLLTIFRRLYLLVSDFPQQELFYGENQSRLNSDEITRSLEGTTAFRWLNSKRQEKLILSVATPVVDSNNDIIGTLLLKQSNKTLLLLQDKTFEQILLLTAGLFLMVTLSLFYFASRLLGRLIKLRNHTEQALSSDGIIANQFYTTDNDEIGDLGRSFYQLMYRLQQHTDYLKTLSGKLSHELRTPLSIVRSSLENMQAIGVPDDIKSYLNRASEGTNRLGDIFNRMGEASRLEQSIQNMEKEPIEFIGFMQQYIAGMQLSNPAIQFKLNCHVDRQVITLSAELIAQLLDKIINNAISFQKPDSALEIIVDYELNFLHTRIKNYGPLIAETELTSLFDSMVSYRTTRAHETHLGLGLHIAKLITDYHQGTLRVENSSKENAVSFILSLPVKSSYKSKVKSQKEPIKYKVLEK